MQQSCVRVVVVCTVMCGVGVGAFPARAWAQLPAGQLSRDIGSPAIAGGTTYSQGRYTIFAGGRDIWGTSDQFRFVYQQVTGDVEIIARVNSLQKTNRWAKAGVMIRETLSANSRNAMALMSASAGFSFQWRLDPGGLSDYTPWGRSRTPAWLRLVRTGFLIEAFGSYDGLTWTSLGAENVPMADTVYVGLAVTSHNVSTGTTAVFDQLKIVETSAPPNQPPVVSITSPATASSFPAPANITINASAADPENRLASVEFYANSTRIGTLTAAPFTFAWNGVATGTYSLTARAFDADGGSATSPAVTVDVVAAATAPRYAVFHASDDHATLVTSYRLDVFGNGANPNTATPVATSDLGKLAPDASGDITVDRATFFAGLASGTYVATVSAIGSGGESRSASVTFTK